MDKDREQDQSTTLSMFNAVSKEQRISAINNLLNGKTPIEEIKERDGRGGEKQKYVNIYYMTRQLSLITGFKWTSECLEERYHPNEENPVEVGAKMRVLIWDGNSSFYSHTSWGQKDIAKWTRDKYDKKGNLVHKAGSIISIFDDLKAAYSDGIKKCLSYFGVANDIYGGKEIEYFETDNNIKTEISQTEASRAFGRFLKDKHISVSKALSILNVKNISEITDFKDAYKKIIAWKEGGEEKSLEENTAK